ncbi:MAG: hypothetical protein HYX43_20995 [Burkholderiales bacterium]|nr:hypothetical protein [Burkholderiales bacterium]
MSKLVDYLNLLDIDATAREAHAKNPNAAMTAHGLNAAEQQALLSGDKTAMATVAGIDAKALPLPQVPNFDTTY